MALVERFFFQGEPEALVKIVGKTPPGSKAAVDLVDFLGAEFLDPASVIQRLGHDLARRAIPLQLNQNE